MSDTDSMMLPELSDLLKNKHVIISKANCPYCVKAANFLTEAGFEYVKLSITDYTEADNFDEFYEEMLSLTGAKTFPIIFIDGKYIGGYTELVAKYKNHVALTDDF